MYSCIKKVKFSRNDFTDIFCREMFDDISGETDIQVRNGKSNHAQSGYNWETITNENLLKTYFSWLENPPENTLVTIS